jgi:taurine dioxygenase
MLRDDTSLVKARIAAMIGIPRDESDAMLSHLYEHMENPLFQRRFRWSENAIAF